MSDKSSLSNNKHDFFPKDSNPVDEKPTKKTNVRGGFTGISQEKVMYTSI